jgi:hypothetical protein
MANRQGPSSASLTKMEVADDCSFAETASGKKRPSTHHSLHVEHDYRSALIGRVIQAQSG